MKAKQVTVSKVMVSNGGYKFHLAPLAVEMAEAGVLSGFLTAGWPSGWQKWLAAKFPRSPGWRRFLDRAEAIPEELVHSVGISEIFFKGADVAIRPWSQDLQQRVHRIGFQVYANQAAKVLRRVRPEIYHYRNCYGLTSVAVAKRFGAISLCDHSIAHPLFLQWLEQHQGEWPSQADLQTIPNGLMPLQKAMAADLSLADHTLVNSDFVKQTCVYAGMNGSKVHVVYWGVDEAFFQLVEAANSTEQVSPQSLLFAGGWQRRKGIETLIEALSNLDIDWQMDVAGGMEPETKTLPGMEDFFKRSQVKYLGILPRPQLAALMKKHRIFVFPSYCEGSARVIFEALAAGSYIITTPNSGSIVENGVHGSVVPAGDIAGLCNAIKEALSHPERVDTIGRSNAKLVEEKYRQRDYGLKVRALYNQLLSE